MFTKTLIASATAALIAAGSLGISTSSASAHGYNIHLSGGYYVTKVIYVPKHVCKPIYKEVSWHDYYGWHSKTIKVGEKCKTIYVKAYKKIWNYGY